MQTTIAALKDIFERIPRRHTTDNVKEMYSLVDEYESVLLEVEGIDPHYEKQAAVFFDDLDTARAAVKKSTDNKASKKSKDEFFDEASSSLKTSIESLIAVLEKPV